MTADAQGGSDTFGIETGTRAGRPRQGDLVRRTIIALTALAVFVPACGSSEPNPGIVRAGQVDIQLPAGWTVEEATVTKPPTVAAEAGPTGSTGPGQEASATTTPPETIPLSEDDPQTAFFKAASVFQTCLDEEGFEFIGVPDANNPNSPSNDPDYLTALGTCASKSNIIQALQNVQKAEDEMTPADIEERNEQYLDWRECMIGKGWGIPEPKPDEKGRLFSFSGAAQGGGPQFDPPAGESLLDSDDFSACIEEVS
jgi:hypothetical protein